MRTTLLITVIMAGAVCVVPAKAAPQPMRMIGAINADVALIEEVGWRRRSYRRYPYPVPYAYYPPPAYYYPPPAYGYYAPVYPAYPYYAPYRGYQSYYAPYY
jgi:hypothetical protein